MLFRSYIRRIQDPLERELEVERVTNLKKKLEDALGSVDLGPRSKFWNYGLSTSQDDPLHVQPVKLLDGDNPLAKDNLENGLYFYEVKDGDITISKGKLIFQ